MTDKHRLTRPTKGIAEANSLGQLTTFASEDLSMLAGGHLSHDQVAAQVRMLLRTDFDHEAVCVMARDRIKWLAHRVAVLEANTMLNAAPTAPLQVQVTAAELVISIGADTLVHAIRHGLQYRYAGDIVVTDQTAFLQAIKGELEREDEDGTTAIHIALDGAASRAIENGEEGFELKPHEGEHA